MTTTAIGGGAARRCFALAAVQRMGVARRSKALTSKNACKACGLGMGGRARRHDGRAGDFRPSVISPVQAQSTDVQPAIPEEVFRHPLAELPELSGREMEHLGRLAMPV